MSKVHMQIIFSNPYSFNLHVCCASAKLKLDFMWTLRRKRAQAYHLKGENTMTENERILYDELLMKSWIEQPGKSISTKKLKDVMIAEIRLNIIRMNNPDEFISQSDNRIRAHRSNCYSSTYTLLSFMMYNLHLLTNEEFEYFTAKLNQAYYDEIKRG